MWNSYLFAYHKYLQHCKLPINTGGKSGGGGSCMCTQLFSLSPPSPPPLCRGNLSAVTSALSWAQEPLLLFICSHRLQLCSMLGSAGHYNHGSGEGGKVSSPCHFPIMSLAGQKQVLERGTFLLLLLSPVDTGTRETPEPLFPCCNWEVQGAAAWVARLGQGLWQWGDSSFFHCLLPASVAGEGHGWAGSRHRKEEPAHCYCCSHQRVAPHTAALCSQPCAYQIIWGERNTSLPCLFPPLLPPPPMPRSAGDSGNGKGSPSCTCSLI